MATHWQGTHIVVLAGASALAFTAGYMLGGRSAPSPPPPPPATNVSNDAAPVFPPFAGNEQAPQRRRVDENQLVAENAEREESGQGQGSTGREERRRETERRRPPREEEPPPDPPFEEEDPGYGPEGSR